MKFILGKKIEMTQRFSQDGRAIPVTVIEGGPCVVTQIKDNEKDGYQAVQLGYSEKKKIGKSLAGQLKKLGKFRYIREFRFNDDTNLKHGDKITVNVFKPGDSVKVIGISKGKGFQGVMKRHGFKGGPGSHGDKDQHRAPGSIGATDAGRVFKGMRMAGHMGSAKATIHNIEVIEVDPEKNLLLLKGSVPGARGSLLLVSALGEMDLTAVEDEKKIEPKKDDKTEGKAVETKEEPKQDKK